VDRKNFECNYTINITILNWKMFCCILWFALNTSKTTKSNGQLLYDIRKAVKEPQHIHQEALTMNQRLEIYIRHSVMNCNTYGDCVKWWTVPIHFFSCDFQTEMHIHSETWPLNLLTFAIPWTFSPYYFVVKHPWFM
jgi:hypothetical protein